MTPAQYRHFGCRITDDLLYKGMRTLFLENELLRVGILLDKGADIFQFLYKPADVDFLWRSPQGLVPPSRFTATRAAGSGAFLDSYHGGWQEILPGGGPADYRGAELGLHGEVTHLGWECAILEDRPERIRVRLSVDCIRMLLEAGQPTLFIEEILTNTSPEDMDLMWGHHPAFGAPFLKEGVRLFLPAGEAQVHSPRFAESGLLEPGACFPWPLAPTNGHAIDLARVPGPQAGFAELLYLKNLSGGWYAVLDPEQKVGFGLSWPLEIFPYLWFWMVYGRAPGYPWWNRAYVIALEPWTSIPNSLDQALQTGTTRHLKGGERLNLSLTASAIAGLDRIHHINPNGSIE
jgi:hypothetical protein